MSSSANLPYVGIVVLEIRISHATIHRLYVIRTLSAQGSLEGCTALCLLISDSSRRRVREVPFIADSNSRRKETRAKQTNTTLCTATKEEKRKEKEKRMRNPKLDADNTTQTPEKTTDLDG